MKHRLLSIVSLLRAFQYQTHRTVSIWIRIWHESRTTRNVLTQYLSILTTFMLTSGSSLVLHSIATMAKTKQINHEFILNCLRANDRLFVWQGGDKVSIKSQGLDHNYDTFPPCGSGNFSAFYWTMFSQTCSHSSSYSDTTDMGQLVEPLTVVIRCPFTTSNRLFHCGYLQWHVSFLPIIEINFPFTRFQQEMEQCRIGCLLARYLEGEHDHLNVKPLFQSSQKLVRSSLRVLASN